MGEQFRKVMAEIDEQCRREKVGPYLDPKDPQYNDKRRYTHCDILKLKPYDPLATEEGRFAHSLKLPPPHDKPKEVYKPSMTAEEYFKALCEAEAGEWVFQTAESVNGVFQARQHEPAPSGYMDVVFFSREKGEFDITNPQDSLVQPNDGRYDYLEVRLSATNASESGHPYIRYFRDLSAKTTRWFQTHENGAFKSIPYVVSQSYGDRLDSRFGFTWRGVDRPNAREHGIEGSELIIFKIESREILAFRRYFIRYYPHPEYKDRRYTAAMSCPKAFSEPPHRFIQKVLVPAKTN